MTFWLKTVAAEVVAAPLQATHPSPQAGPMRPMTWMEMVRIQSSWFCCCSKHYWMTNIASEVVSWKKNFLRNMILTFSRWIEIKSVVQRTLVCIKCYVANNRLTLTPIINTHCQVALMGFLTLYDVCCANASRAFFVLQYIWKIKSFARIAFPLSHTDSVSYHQNCHFFFKKINSMWQWHLFC